MFVEVPMFVLVFTLLFRQVLTRPQRRHFLQAKWQKLTSTTTYSS